MCVCVWVRFFEWSTWKIKLKNPHTHTQHFQLNIYASTHNEKKTHLKYIFFPHLYTGHVSTNVYRYISGSYIHARTHFAIQMDCRIFSYSVSRSFSHIVCLFPRYAAKHAYYSMQPKSNFIIRIKLVKLASTKPTCVHTQHQYSKKRIEKL